MNSKAFRFVAVLALITFSFEQLTLAFEIPLEKVPGTVSGDRQL